MYEWKYKVSLLKEKNINKSKFCNTRVPLPDFKDGMFFWLANVIWYILCLRAFILFQSIHSHCSTGNFVLFVELHILRYVQHR